jgi:protein ImuA
MAAGLSLVPGGSVAGTPSQRRWAAQRPRAGLDFPAEEGGGCAADQLPRPALATLSELFAASPRDGGWAGLLLTQLGPLEKPLLWIQQRIAILETGRVHPPGLGGHALIHVETGDAREALWAMEEGLRCTGLSAVIGEIWGDPASLDFTATRRLAVAAEANGVAAWLVRLGGTANLSGARMRWRVGSAPSEHHPLNPRAPGSAAWTCELFRARGAAPGKWRVADELSPPNPVDLAAAAGDRALAQGQRRTA